MKAKARREGVRQPKVAGRSNEECSGQDVLSWAAKLQENLRCISASFERISFSLGECESVE